MPLNFTGSGPGGAIQVPPDEWSPAQGENVRQDLVAHEQRIEDLETVLAGGAGGDVTGPASSTDNEIPRFSGTGGKTLQGSGITIPDGQSATVSGTNTGDVTLAGTGGYLSLVGQVLTQALIDLAAHVTGRLPWANVVQVTGNRLLGRVSSSGDVQEIAIGSGLALDGSGLRVTASGGGSPALDDLTDVAITAPTTGDVVMYNGSGWVNGSTGDVVGPASSVDGELALFDSTTGKLLKRATGSGFARVASGVYSAAPLKRPFAMMIGDGVNTIGTGVQGFFSVPFTGTITKVRLLSSDAAVTTGSIVIDVWKDTYANYPPTDADSITASAQPTITAGTKSEDATLTGWTTSVTAGDVIGLNVDSVTSLKRVTIELTIEE